MCAQYSLDLLFRLHTLRDVVTEGVSPPTVAIISPPSATALEVAVTLCVAKGHGDEAKRAVRAICDGAASSISA